MKPVVLIVDDRPNFLSLLAKVLGRDVEVLTARGVHQAIGLLGARPPDAVVCDLRMPDGHGIQVLRALRSRGSAAPFVLMTAYATVPTAVQAMREGAYDYITKPFDPDALRTLVLRALAESTGSGAAAAMGPAGPGASGGPLRADGEAGAPSARAASADVEAPVGRPLADMTYREVVDLARDEITRRYLEAVLAAHRGNVTAAAAQAGVERESFYRLLRRHDVRAEAFRADGEGTRTKTPPRGG